MKSEAEDTKIVIIATNITGKIIRVTLAIALNPNRFITVEIAIKTRITTSKSILGKYIKTRLSEKILMTNAEIIIR